MFTESSALYDTIYGSFKLALEQVTRALRCSREHVAPDGIVVVEPWFSPGVPDDGHVSRVTGGSGGRVGQDPRSNIG